MEIVRIAKNKKNGIDHGIPLEEFGSKPSCFHNWENHLTIKKHPNGFIKENNGSLISQEQYDKAMTEREQSSPRNFKTFKNWESKNSK